MASCSTFYVSKGADGGVREDFFLGWKFIVFQPDQPIAAGTLDLAAVHQPRRHPQGHIDGTLWATGREYMVSAELGIEPVDGTGDLTLYNLPRLEVPVASRRRCLPQKSPFGAFFVCGWSRGISRPVRPQLS